MTCARYGGAVACAEDKDPPRSVEAARFVAAFCAARPPILWRPSPLAVGPGGAAGGGARPAGLDRAVVVAGAVAAGCPAALAEPWAARAETATLAALTPEREA